MMARKGNLGRVALYHRVSTVDQNPRAARKELRAAAKRYGFRVELDIEETGSGANGNRPGLRQVLEAARRGTVDVVMVWKLDRFGRSALDLLTHIRELESRKCRFIALTQSIDLRGDGDAMASLMITMLAAVAEFERDLIRERTVMGLEATRARGTRLGRPPTKRPLAREVTVLRSKNRTWAEISLELGCSVWACRTAAKNGGAKAPAKSRANS